MTLGDLIATLKEHPAGRVVYVGFNNPHSYRGYYEQVAFEPAENISIGEMLAAAEEALGSTYQGWKGGDYTMSSYTSCWIANEGDTGDELSERLLSYMLADEVRP